MAAKQAESELITSFLPEPRQRVRAPRPQQRRARDDHLRAIAAAHPNFKAFVFDMEPLPQDRQGRDVDYPGLVDIDRIADAVLLSDADDDICGPIAFMRLLQDGPAGAAQLP